MEVPKEHQLKIIRIKMGEFYDRRKNTTNEITEREVTEITSLIDKEFQIKNNITISINSFHEARLEANRITEIRKTVIYLDRSAREVRIYKYKQNAMLGA